MSKTQIANRSIFGGRRKRLQFFLVLIVAVTLPAQGAYSFSTENEPYPTIRMPSFGDAPTSSGYFVDDYLDIRVELSDGRTIHPSPDRLASDVRFSSARKILDLAFRPTGDGIPNPNASNPAVVSWLRSHASDLASTSVDKVTFCWRKRSVDIANGEESFIGECELESIQL